MSIQRTLSTKMQPPPRKGSSVKFLKNLHSEQIAKLQVKNQTECELLEDLRSFIIKKSALEKSYCEALLKITSVYLNKKITTSIPDLKTEGSDERWNMWSVWRTVLEENEKLSKARLAAIEVFSQQIADDAKILRYQKLQTTKKCVDLLASIQKEIQITVQDIEKTRKVYFDEEHCAHDVRDKAKDIEARLKKKKGSFFTSITTLQKKSATVSLKREQMDDKSVGARNDYLLSLATANAHQTRYFVNDLQNIMQTMESGVYEKVQDYFSLIGRAELLTCAATQSSFSKIRDQAQKLTREYNLQCLYLYYPVLKQHIQYEFEACDGDNIDYITSGSSTTALQFVEEVKEWLEIIGKERRAIRNNSQKLRNLFMLRESGERVDPNDPNGMDVDTKIDELQEAIRRSEVIKVKTEAKLELLKKSNDENVRDMCRKLEEELGSSIDIEDERTETMQRPSVTEFTNTKIEEKSYSSDEETTPYKAPEKDSSVEEDMPVSSNTYAAYQTPAQNMDVFQQFEASWDTDDRSASPLPESSSLGIYRPMDDVTANASYEEFDTPVKCVVLYNYTAQNPDELTIVASEELTILGEGDGDGWLRARNNSGQEGFVPCTYLDAFSGDEEHMIMDHEDDGLPMGSGSHLTSQISFSSVDYTVNVADTAQSVCGGDGDAVSGDSSASIVTTVQDLDNQRVPQQSGDDYEYCIALYDYDAGGEDELAFQEGQVIRVLRKTVHDDIDDGWWEGELEGRVGLFPSLMVQICSEDGSSFNYDDGVEPESAPPLFTPPDVPDHFLADCPTEQDSNMNSNPGDNGADKFSFEMSDNQQKQYNAQFSGQASNDSRDTKPASGSTLPDISINIVSDDDVVQDPSLPVIVEDVVPDETDANDSNEAEGEFNLGVTQIVITAPTPSSDSPDKRFPPDPAPDDSSMSVAAVLLERRKSAGEINEADPPMYDTSLNECVDYPTTIIEEPEEEEEEEEKYAEEMKYERRVSATNNDQSYDRRRSSGSVASVSYPQCVPENIEPHQLQRLPQLKESNA